jgi:hypothetical protein
MEKRMIKLTDWFSEYVNPVHVGVYQTNRNKQGLWFRHWNGEFWGLCAEKPVEAAAAKNIKSPAPAFPWRGVYREIS